jgi:hypothetical protein
MTLHADTRSRRTIRLNGMVRASPAPEHLGMSLDELEAAFRKLGFSPEE